MNPAVVVKDAEFVRALEDLQRLISLVRISSVKADPKTFIRFSEKMSEMQAMLVRKLVEKELQNVAQNNGNVGSPPGETPGLRGEPDKRATA